MLDGVKPMNTPRSKLAMSRLGLSAEELQIKRYQDFYIPGDLQEKQRMKFIHYETKRQDKMATILKERARILIEEEKKKKMPPDGLRRGMGNMVAMECLLEKEAGRLEHGLGQQIRYHQAVEIENERQLDREKQLGNTLERRQEKVIGAKAQVKSKAAMAKMLNKARRQNSEKLIQHIKDQREAKQVNHLTKILETDIKLKNFLAFKEANRKEASDGHCAHLAAMDAKLREMSVERLAVGEDMKQKKENKIQQLAERKEQLKQESEIKMCDKHLKHGDVLERKQRVNRQQEHRLSLLKDEKLRASLRIDRMLQLKDEVIAQRKKRLHAPVKFKTINIKDLPVGPGQYDVDRDKVLHELPVPIISDAHIEKGHVMFTEMNEKITKDNPPPGTYDVPLTKTGDEVSACTGQKVAFSKGDFDNFAEQQAKLTKANPGPGRYNPKSNLFHPTLGVKITRPIFPKKETEPPPWCEAHLSCTPGPAAYTVDTFTRKEGLQRFEATMPNLTKALLCNPKTSFSFKM